MLDMPTVASSLLKSMGWGTSAWRGDGEAGGPARPPPASAGASRGRRRQGGARAACARPGVRILLRRSPAGRAVQQSRKRKPGKRGQRLPWERGAHLDGCNVQAGAKGHDEEEAKDLGQLPAF
jgi:hypothetical protein